MGSVMLAAFNSGLLCLDNALLWAIGACCFGLLDIPRKDEVGLAKAS